MTADKWGPSTSMDTWPTGLDDLMYRFSDWKRNTSRDVNIFATFVHLFGNYGKQLLYSQESWQMDSRGQNLFNQFLRRHRELSLKMRIMAYCIWWCETWWNIPKLGKSIVEILSRSSMMIVERSMALLSWSRQDSWRILDVPGHHHDG